MKGSEKFIGVFESAVARDSYRLRLVRSHIDTVFDIGANVGMFSLASRVLFPSARIIAIEPDPQNFAMLKLHTRLWPKITCLNSALGVGKDVYYRMGSGPSHSHHKFVTPSESYPRSQLEQTYSHALEVPTVTISSLAKEYGLQNLLVKIDVEGGEDCLVEHKKSNAILRKAKYICMELHFYSLTPNLQHESEERLRNWIQRFQSTHKVETEFTSNGGLVWLSIQ